MNAEAIRAQLDIMLRTLQYAAQRVFETDPTRTGSIDDIVSTWTRLLTGEPSDEAYEVALAILETLVSAERAATPAFWYSELGTAVARAGAVPTAVSVSVAAAILGVTRQRASELLKQGKLRRAGASVVAGDSVLAYARTRQR